MKIFAITLLAAATTAMQLEAEEPATDTQDSQMAQVGPEIDEITNTLL